MRWLSGKGAAVQLEFTQDHAQVGQVRTQQVHTGIANKFLKLTEVIAADFLTFSLLLDS